MKHVWINLADIDAINDRESLVCIPLLVVSDCEYLGTFCKTKLDHFDEAYLVYAVESDERADAIPAAYDLLGVKKMGRKVRTRVTVNPPDNAWKCVSNE